MRSVTPSGEAEGSVSLYTGFLEYGSEYKRSEQFVCPYFGSQRSGSGHMSDQTVSPYSGFLL